MGWQVIVFTWIIESRAGSTAHISALANIMAGSCSAGVGASDATWTVDDTSKLTGGRAALPTGKEGRQ
jgi:hypothetical protein